MALRRRLAPILLCVAVLSSAPGPSARAADPIESHAEALRRRIAELEQRAAEESRARREWQERERERLEAVRKAREELQRTEAARVRAQDGAYDGVKRSEWTRRAKEAQAVLERAERDLADFYDEARREEVPPGWLKASSDEAPASTTETDLLAD